MITKEGKEGSIAPEVPAFASILAASPTKEHLDTLLKLMR